MTDHEPGDLQFQWVPVERITHHFFQPRRGGDREDLLQLMVSIDTLGVLQPLLLRPRGAGFELISGYRRLQACRKLGNDQVPAIVREMSDEEALQAAICSNTTSADLRLFERCESVVYATKVLDDTSPLEITQWFGTTEEFLGIANKLVSMQPILRESLLQNLINPSQAIELNRIADSGLLATAVGRVVRGRLSQADTLRLVEHVIEHREVPDADTAAEEEADAEALPPLRVVERIYRALAERQQVDSDSLRALLGWVLKEADRPLEEFLCLEYDSAETFYLWQHVLNVTRLAVHTARQTGLEPNDVAVLGLCAMLHDVGMLAVPRAILDKAAALTPEERSQIRVHPEEGGRMLHRAELREETIYAAIRHHHERNDGSGYPLGLRGAKIHRFARILAVVDTYEALISPRVYRLPLAPPRAIIELQGLAGKGVLDADTTAAFVKAMSHFPPGSRVRLSNGECGVVTRVNPTHPDRPVIRLTPGSDAPADSAVRTELDLLASPRISIIG